ncbi:MAG: esterase-like activity of phytase family protein [Rhodobacteraceae bacterium]|nr:esterase-like activity of phytase family protein [Paracoccaceae bacterium]
MFAQAQTLTPAGRIVLKLDLEGFGGLSGIEMSADGNFLAVSDIGQFVKGSITRIDGEIGGATIAPLRPILDSKGKPLTGFNTNAESLAIGPDGSIYIAFEGNHRIMRHETLTAAAQFLPKHPDFKTFQRNSGLEALAINADGILLTIPERSGKETRPFPVYMFDGNEWSQPTSIPRDGDFLVTGADFGPDGRFYVLERAFKVPFGFATRIRRFTFVYDTLTNGETLLVARNNRLDNMEGISVWADQQGQTRLTLVSDDNFNPLLRTVIAEYLVND